MSKMRDSLTAIPLILATLFPFSTQLYAMDGKHEESPIVESTCRICSKEAPKKCSKCKKAAYCSVECQGIDWRQGHKSSCGKETASNMLASFSSHFTAGLEKREKVKASPILMSEFQDECQKIYGSLLTRAIITGCSCLDYVIFKALGFDEMTIAKGVLKIKVDQNNNSIEFFQSKNFYFTEEPQNGDIIIYFDQNEKAIHFGVMTEDEKVISKPGHLANSIFIHDIDAFEDLYGKQVKFMRKSK